MIWLIKFMLVAGAAFMGMIAGLLLSCIAPEELEPGKKYLWFFQNAMFILLMTVFFAFNLIDFWSMVFYGTLFLIWLYAVNTRRLDAEFHRTLYIGSAILLYLSSARLDWFILTASGIFLYGLPTASLYNMKHKNKSRRCLFLDILGNYGPFLLLALVLAVLG